MDWDKFTINASGKVTIENVVDLGGLKLSNENLTVLKLSDGKYFINKEAIINLGQYTKQNLEKNPVYIQVGHVIKEINKGITARITDLERLNRILKEVREN